ncbi:MAG: glycosyltransferase [Anaerolineaceae bacterium]|nr:glycosyltransferase [Anaerolineaceae bacterium]
MKHLLFLSWWWPYPANNGAKIRIYNLLRHLSKQYQVTLLSFAEDGDATGEQIAHLKTFCQHVEAVPKPIYNPGALKATLGYFSRWPRSLVDVYSTDMAERVARINQTQPVDIIVASQFQTMRYIELLPDVPAVLEELEITQFHNTVEQASDMPRRLRAQLTLSKFQQSINHLVRSGAAATVVSKAEAAYISQFLPPDTRIEVVPNGVDTKVNQPDASVQSTPYSLIYTGAVTYSANYDAVAYFVREIWPLVHARYPQAMFTVTGGTGSVDVADLAAVPGVKFSGYLPSVADAVRQQWAVVAPIRIGGGTRLKILEAMALGTPVISTSKGAEGLDVHHGQDILIADSSQAFADAVSQLFEDATLRDKLAAGGRALVERDYDWGALTCRLIDLIEQMLTDTQKVKA